MEKVHPDGNHEITSRFFSKKVFPIVQQAQQFEGIENAPGTKPDNAATAVTSIGQTLYGYIVRNLMAKREQGILLPLESSRMPEFDVVDGEGTNSPQQVSPTAFANNAEDKGVYDDDEDRDGEVGQRVAEYLEYIAHASDSDDNDLAISISSCSEEEFDCD